MRNKRITGIFLKIINFFTFKKARSVYFHLGTSSKNNYEDIINNTGSNPLSFAYFFINQKFSEPITIYLEYFDEKRLPLYQTIIEKAKDNNIKLCFVRSFSDKTGLNRIKTFIRAYLKLFKCKIWIITTGDNYLYGKLKKQSIIDFNYFISCKNDYIPKLANRWSYLDGIITTSKLASMSISSQAGVDLGKCLELGFPRNDTLFHSVKKDAVLKWINDEIGYFPKKIIVYAPTYRDYEIDESDSFKRHLFGYRVDELDSFIKENHICIICKLHNLTKLSSLKILPGVLLFKLCYDFSFYDLLAITDCLITDYSSVGYDYMLKNKPIIYNLYDLEKYTYSRGLSYEPYEDFCPGEVVHNSKELKDSFVRVLSEKDLFKDKRIRLTRLFHKNNDGCSCERVLNYICERFGFERVHK